MSDTPETDDAYDGARYNTTPGKELEALADFARELERRLRVAQVAARIHKARHDQLLERCVMLERKVNKLREVW